MFGVHLLDAFVILFYFIVIVGIGFWASRRIKNEDDFLLGGRTFGKILQTFMNFGMATNADTSIGAARETFRQGIAGIWIQLFYLFSTPFYWFTTVMIRRFRFSSMGEFYRLRYQSRAMEMAFSFFGILLLTTIISTGMVALEKTVSAIVVKSEAEMTASEKAAIENFEALNRLELKLKHASLSAEEQDEYERLISLKSHGQVKSIIPAMNPVAFLVAISVVLLVYTIAGGVVAAAITDVLQGVLLIILSLLLLPFGLEKIGWFTGFHAQVPDYYFKLFGTGAMSEYPWYYIFAIMLVGLMMTEPMPQNIQIMGSAKDEESARWGRITGNLMKRFVVILWGFTGLVGYALYKTQISDPDMLWGHMSRELLVPGLIGLMIICLLAALQSTASAYMVTLSALFTRGLFEPLFPNRSDRTYMLAGRIAIGVMLFIATWTAMYFHDFLRLLRFFWSLGLIFGPVFWVAVFWRNATSKAAWTAIVYTFVFTVLCGYFIENVKPVTRMHALTRMTRSRVVEMETGAVREDVESGRAEIIGQTILKKITLPSVGVFFEEVVRENPDDPNSRMIGKKRFRPSLLYAALAGVPLEKMSKAGLISLGYYLDILMPVLLIIIISLFTRKNSKEALDQFYGRLKTPAMGTLKEQDREMALTAKNPGRFDHNKLFPNSSIELMKPTKRDVWGFVIIWGFVVIVLLFILGLARIGA